MGKSLILTYMDPAEFRRYKVDPLIPSLVGADTGSIRLKRNVRPSKLRTTRSVIPPARLSKRCYRSNFERNWARQIFITSRRRQVLVSTYDAHRRSSLELAGGFERSGSNNSHAPVEEHVEP